MPIAVWFRPTVWRHMSASGTSWWIVPSRPITKCVQTPGRSPRFGAFEANVSNALEKLFDAVKCSTITFGSRSRCVATPEWRLA
jgi:hypothetical protein